MVEDHLCEISPAPPGGTTNFCDSEVAETSSSYTTAPEFISPFTDSANVNFRSRMAQFTFSSQADYNSHSDSERPNKFFRSDDFV